MTKHSMERTFALMLALLATQACSDSPATTADTQPDAKPTPTAKSERPVPACTDALRSNSPLRPNEVARNRRFELPVIRYPFGAARKFWGFGMGLRIDESGRVACYHVGEDVELGGERLAVLRTVGGWQYTPFARGGKPITAFVYEHVGEEERPQARLALPDVPLEQVRISLERSFCMGSCNYRVEVRGDGTAFYSGKGFTIVEGEHRYSVPPSEVARLVDSLRSKDIWSLRSAYRAQISDAPENELSFTFGPHTRKLSDYMGQEAGMPRAVSEFEDEVDRAARIAMWNHFEPGAVEILKAEGFEFSSVAGAELLARAVAFGENEDAMLALIELGAPLEMVDSPKARHQGLLRPLLEVALSNRRGRVAKVLIDRGALNRDGRRDRKKIDAAFRAAVAGGRLKLVELVWNAAGSAHRPKLMFHDTTAGKYTSKAASVSKQSPLTLTLRRTNETEGWEGAAIAEWLAARGCDLNARSAYGETLLHIAANSGDEPLVRYLLEEGVDPLVPNKFGYLAMTGTGDENVALMLLEAGAGLLATQNDVGRLRFATERKRLRFTAEREQWQRILERTESHPSEID